MKYLKTLSHDYESISRWDDHDLDPWTQEIIDTVYTEFNPDPLKPVYEKYSFEHLGCVINEIQRLDENRYDIHTLHIIFLFKTQ